MTSMDAKSSVAILTDDVLADIFSFLGASDTAKSSEVCQQWRRVASNSRSLWRRFVRNDFRLEEGGQVADWRKVYAYLSQQLKDFNRSVEEQFHHAPPLSARVLFSDDGSPVPGYPPEHAIKRHGGGAWCTNAGVEEDVDLVFELPEVCLIVGFEAANGGRFYSAPLKEALVFASNQPINLEGTRKYNGKNGSKWAKKLSEYGNMSAKSHDPAFPLAGFCFPPLPQAFYARSQEQLSRPIAARYIHFKLLSSYKPPGMLADNIDVKDLLTFGVKLPELPKLLKRTNLNDPLPQDPSYRRMHELRDYPY